MDWSRPRNGRRVRAATHRDLQTAVTVGQRGTPQESVVTSLFDGKVSNTEEFGEVETTVNIH